VPGTAEAGGKLLATKGVLHGQLIHTSNEQTLTDWR
jgi:hypothetical protein